MPALAPGLSSLARSQEAPEQQPLEVSAPPPIPAQGPTEAAPAVGQPPIDVSLTPPPQAEEPAVVEPTIVERAPEVQKPITKNPYDPYIQKAAETYNLDPFLLKSLIKQESAFNSGATGPKTKYGTAKGLTQMIDATAKDMGVTDPYDPAQSILGGAKYLKKMMDRYKGNTLLALAAYNAGPGNVDKHNGIPPFKETIDYTAKIAKHYQEYTGRDISGTTGGIQTLEAVSKDEPSGNDFLDIFLSPFVSTAQAAESSEAKRTKIKNNLLEAKAFVEGKGGWDKLTPNQQQLIETQIGAYKNLEPKAETVKKLKSEIDGIKWPKIAINYGDQYNTWLSNSTDLMFGPSTIGKDILEGVGVDVPDLPFDNITKGFKESFAEKFVGSASLGFLQGNMEKPFETQSKAERAAGFAGSVLGTIAGYAMPLTAPAKILKGAKALLPLHRTMGEALGMFGIGSMEALSHGKNPIYEGAKFAAFPLGLKALGLGFGAAKQLRGSMLEKWVTKHFVPDELNGAVEAARQGKTYEQFQRILTNSKTNLQGLSKYFMDSPKYAGEKAGVVLKSDLQKFYQNVKGGKVDSIEGAIRPFVNTLLKSKRQVKIANNLEKIVTGGGEVIANKPGPVKAVVKGLIDYGLRPMASVLKKYDPVNGTKFEAAVENYASQYRYALGASKQHLDDMLEGVSPQDFSNAVKILERKLTPAEYSKLAGNKFEELAVLAHNLDRTLKAIGSRLIKSGITFSEPVSGNVAASGLIQRYFPHKFTEKQLHRFMKMDATDLVDMGEFLVKTKQAANLEEGIAKWKSYVEALAYKQPVIGKASFEHARLNVPGYRMDKGALYEYMDEASQRLAFAENFGKNGEKLLETGTLLKRHGADSTFVDESVNRILGTETKHAFTKAFHVLRQVNTFLFSPATTALNLSQRTGIPIEAGLESFAKGMANKQVNARLINKSGAINQKALDEIKKMQVGAVESDSWLSKAQDKYLTALGWKHVETFNRADSVSAGIENVKKLFDGIKRNPKDVEYRRMAESLIGKDRLNQASKRGFLNQQDLVKAGQQLEKDTQFWYLATDMPLFFTSQVGKVLGQFKASAYLYSQFLKKQVYEEAKKGNAKPLFYWMTLGSASNELVGDARRAIAGKDPFDPNDFSRPGLDDPAGRYVQNLLFEGQGMGLVSDVLNTFRVYEKTKNAAVFANLLGGPTASKAADIMKGFADWYSFGNTDSLKKTGLGYIPTLGPYLKTVYFPPKDSKELKRGRTIGRTGPERVKIIKERRKARKRS